MRTTEIYVIGCTIGVVAAYLSVCFIAWDMLWPAWFAHQLPFDRLLIGIFYIFYNALVCTVSVMVTTLIAEDYKRY